ncbi:MAG: hypothetical protein ACFFB3_17350 [Candidatus Hodarchaeota archaeon]
MTRRDSREEALTIGFLTLFAIFLFRLADEYLYFRSSNAAYATGLFVFIPSGLAISSSLVAAVSPWLGDNFLYGQLDLTVARPGQYVFFLNSFAVIFALPFYAIAAYLILQYSQRSYRTAYLARRRLPGRFAGFTYSLVLIGATIGCWFYFYMIEITSALFVMALLALLLYYYIWEALSGAFQSSSYPTQSRPRTRARPTQTRRRQPGIQTTTQRSQARPATFPAQASVASTTATRPAGPPVAAVSPGIEASELSRSSFRVQPSTTRAAPRRLTQSRSASSSVRSSQSQGKLANLLPTGNSLSEDDFRCIFCYEFPASSSMVVICPYCKRPAHLREFQKWQSTSHLCSRCNKDLRRRKPIQITGREYQGLLRAFRRHR